MTDLNLDTLSAKNKASLAAVLPIMKLASQLSVEDQRILNRLLVLSIRKNIKAVAVEKSAAIEIGDYVQFNAKTRGDITIKVDGFSRDGTKVKGVQVNKGFALRAVRGTKWTAGCAGVKVLTKELGEKIAAAQ